MYRREAPSSRGSRALGWLLAFAASGCLDDDPRLPTEIFAELCGELLGCNCDEPQFTDIEQCTRVHAVHYTDLMGTAAVLGLELDDECILGRIPVTTYHCSTYAEVDDAPEPACRYCAPIHGDAAVGATCVLYDGYSDCVSGLRCVDGRCVDPCAPGDVPIPCEPGRRCTPRFYCEPNSELCLPVPQAGDSCPPECAKGLVCQYWLDPSTCGPRPGEGDRCSSECEAGLICTDGYCQPPAQPGEPCVVEVCGDDADCDPVDHVCRAHAAPGESCGLGGPSCVAAAYCDYDVGRCEADHELGGACSGSYTCVDGLRCHGEPPVCSLPEDYVCGQ